MAVGPRPRYMKAMTSLLIKICGLSTPETLAAALDAGCDMVGFVFFPPSPRHLTPPAAQALAARVEGRAARVALTVDADDATFDAIVAALDPEWLQLHGQESPERVAQVRRRYGRPIMKALGLSVRADLAKARTYEGVADRLLFDAKPPPGAGRPGGNGLAFDWRLLQGRVGRDWMLSGGLTPDNVAEAVTLLDPPGIDVSSGVESRPGIKDPALIASFIARARAAERRRPTATFTAGSIPTTGVKA
jgi:phosphoribosylanthranilate isomerase